MSHLTRETSEARTRAKQDWIRDHVKPERQYRPPPGGRLRKYLRRDRKEVVIRFYQSLSGHAAIETLAERTREAPSSACWWCGSGKRQSCHHLVTECRRWTPEIKTLWKEVGKACRWKHPRAPSVRLLFRDERTTPAFLKFLRTTKVGRRVTLAPQAKEELEGIELCPPEGDQ